MAMFYRRAEDDLNLPKKYNKNEEHISSSTNIDYKSEFKNTNSKKTGIVSKIKPKSNILNTTTAYNDNKHLISSKIANKRGRKHKISPRLANNHRLENAPVKGIENQKKSNASNRVGIFINDTHSNLDLRLKKIPVPDLHFLKGHLNLPLDLITVYQPAPFLLLLEFENRDWPTDFSEVENVKSALLAETYKKLCQLKNKKNIKPCGINQKSFFIEYFNTTYTVQIFHHNIIDYLTNVCDAQLIEHAHLSDEKNVTNHIDSQEELRNIKNPKANTNKEIQNSQHEYLKSKRKQGFMNNSENTHEISKFLEDESQEIRVHPFKQSIYNSKSLLTHKETEIKNNFKTPKILHHDSIGSVIQDSESVETPISIKRDLQKPNRENQIRNNESSETELSPSKYSRKEKIEQIPKNINPIAVLNQFLYLPEYRRTAIGWFIRFLDCHGYQIQRVPFVSIDTEKHHSQEKSNISKDQINEIFTDDDKNNVILAGKLFIQMIVSVANGFYSQNNYNHNIILPFFIHKQPFTNLSSDKISDRLQKLCKKTLSHIQNTALASLLKPALDDYDFVFSWEKNKDLEGIAEFKKVSIGNLSDNQLTHHEKVFHKNVLFSDTATLRFLTQFSFILPSHYHQLIMVKIKSNRDLVLSILMVKGNFQFIYMRK